MSKVLVGRDATAYIVQGGGVDSLNNGWNGGPSYNILGVWKDISVKVSNEWVDVTPSSAELKEKRRTTQDWKATLTNRVRSGGSAALALALSNDYVMVVFTECATGKTITAVGGITDAGYDRGNDAASDTLEIENVGMYNGGPSLTYG